MAKRWEAKARDVREQFDIVCNRLRRTEENHDREAARLRALNKRLQGQLTDSLKRKDELVERSRRAVAEAKELRGRLERAERAVHAYGADDRLDKLELKAKLEQLENALLRADAAERRPPAAADHCREK